MCEGTLRGLEGCELPFYTISSKPGGKLTAKTGGLTVYQKETIQRKRVRKKRSACKEHLGNMSSFEVLLQRKNYAVSIARRIFIYPNMSQVPGVDARLDCAK